WTSPLDYPTLEGQIGRREGYTEYGRSSSLTILTRAGRRLIAKLRKQTDGPQSMGVTIGDGTESGAGHYAPYVDYRAGSRVTLDIPGEYSSVAVQVNAIVGNENAETGAAELTLEFEEVPWTPSAGL